MQPFERAGEGGDTCSIEQSFGERARYVTEDVDVICSDGYTGSAVGGELWRLWQDEAVVGRP